MANLIHHRLILSERELLDDLLMSEDQITNGYNTGISKSTCNDFRKILSSCLSNAHYCQFHILSTKEQRGWCESEEASSNYLESIKSKYESIFNELR